MSELTDITPQTITLKEAMDAVASWPEGFGFHLHRIARPLYDEVCRLQGEVNELNVDRHNQAEAIRQERAEVERLSREADSLLHVATVQRGADDIVKTMAGYNDKLAAERDMAQREHARVQDERQGIISQMIEFRDERDTMKADYAKLEYQMRAMGLSLTNTPDGYMCRKEQYTLEGIIDLMDGWRDDVECWGLHQMCRVLRAAYEGQRENFGNALKEWNRWEREASCLQRTFDLRWDADQRAIKRWQVSHPGNDLVWPDRSDMVVWLLEEQDRLKDEYVDGAGRLIDEREDILSQVEAADRRIMAAIPCARAKDDCHCPDYRWAPCCNLRVALWPGEEFPTDYLVDSGQIHLFHSVNPEYPGAPLASAGCVKLVEPTYDDAIADLSNTALLDALEGALNLSCTET